MARQMTSYSQLNDIALALLQVTALLLPVVFLTMNFVKDEGYTEFSDKIQTKIAKNFIYMIGCLTVTGLLGSIGLLDFGAKRFVLFCAVVLLAGFFAFYGYFIYLLLRGAE